MLNPPFKMSYFNTFHLLLIIFLTITIQNVNTYTLCTTQQSSCLICPIQCTKCDSNFLCTSCSLQYYLSNTLCLSCSSYCLSCTTSSNCIQCKDPYVLINGTCSECVVSNALTCSSTVSASSCISQYYTNQNYCSSCLLNCKTCTSSSTCTQCIDNFYLNNTILTCNPCPSNCITCNQYTPAICTSCKSGYLLNNITNTCDTIDCSIIDNCVYCSSNNVCGRCQLFYYWDGSNCVVGSSVLCDYGSSGPLPSQCVNDCLSSSYKSQTVPPFVCIPYKTVKMSSYKLSQIYYYAFADQSDFQTLSQTLNTIQMQSNGQYSYSASVLNLGVIPSFYKIQMRMKYISTSSFTMQITSSSQSSSQIQSQSTTFPSNLSPNSITYITHSVHSNNLKINFSQTIKIIELFLKIYKCPSTCLQCLNTELCELCQQPNYMLGYSCVSNCTVYYHFALNRTCLLNCPSGYYYVNGGTNNKYCQICQSPCSDCINSTQCLSCVTNYYFYNYTCSNKCPTGYYANKVNNTCDNCISPCMTCTSKTNCLSCQEGYWNGTKCTILCSSGTYGNNSTKTCQLCDKSCLTCANTSISCASCTVTLYLHNKQCISSCPQRYFSSGVTSLTCLSCKPPCQACISPINCTTCAYNFYFNNFCIPICPDGYFENLINNTCTQCSSSCKTCSSFSFCDSCTTDKCLYQGQCVSSCPSQAWYQIINVTSNQCTCQECKYPCKQCLSESSCLSCLEGYLQGINCLTQCPTTYHKNDTLHQCILCNATFSNCNQCTQLKCILCDSGYLLYAGGCLTQCPQYYYESNEKCSKCIAPCLQCTGFQICNSCIDGYILYLSQCIISCPVGKYSYIKQINMTNLTQCETCQSPCLYCVDTATKCTFCQSSFYLYNNSCYKNCSTLTPSSTFYNQPVTSTCTKCLFPCKTCLNQYQCESCIIGYLNTVDKKCKQCQVGTYPDSTSGYCQNCPTQCVICYNDNYCTSCNDGFYLFQNMCISNLTICQINGYYGVGRLCTLCQQPCKTCSKSATNCTTCLDGYTFFISTNQCLVECPNGYYRNSNTSNCGICSTECTSCVGSSTYCFSCVIGYMLYTSEMKCLSSCPKYTYPEGYFCTSCKYPCLECTSETSCTSCISGSLVGRQCMSSCSSGYYSNKQMICQACSSGCKQCSTSGTNCTQCPSNTYLFNNSCVVTCPSQTFSQSQSQKCISCMGTCYECSSHINCTSCSNGLYFYISYLTNQGQCVSTCPNGYYSSALSNLCLKCLAQCLTCSNASACLLCNNGKVMYNGSCFTECPSQMYSYQGVCQKCQQPCYNCSDTMTCTSCMDNSFLLVGSAQCIEGPICPVGYFLLENQPKCNSQCPSSYYHLKSNRTCNAKGCSDDQFRGVDYYCYQQCPDNFIANQALYCESCSLSSCSEGLFFSVKYFIKNDDIIVKVTFTQTPKYLIDQPLLTITPTIAYNLLSYLSVSQNVGQSQNFTQTHQVSSAAYTQGSKTLIFTLTPSITLEQTYFKIKFKNPLQSFKNPLQHSSSTFFLIGYNKYNKDELSDMSNIGILTLFCAIIGLFKNPYMTDFAQILWILALNNIHYPFNLRTFLESTKISTLNGFLGIQQPNMDGSGKFSYLVNDGLLQNAFGNIIIVFIGFIIGAITFGIWKFLQWYVEYARVGGKVSPNQQKFIKNINQNDQNFKSPKQTSIDSNVLPLTVRAVNFISQIYTIQNFKLLYMNRFIYFNYLPICLFTFTQISNINTDSSVNLLAFVLAILMLFLILFYPFAFVKDKPKFTFLYARKAVVALSVILSVNYPAYCIGLLSVCSITASVLIMSYKLQQWKVQTRFHAIAQGLQVVLMIGFAIFVMIGQGNGTQFKAYFGYILVLISIAILLFYVLFAVFLVTLWLIQIICGKDYKQQWIDEDKLDDSDGTDSQTMNSSMKDHQQKKMQAQKIKQKPQNQLDWNNIEQVLKNGGMGQQNFIQGQIVSDYIQTRPLGISPSKIVEQNVINKQLFWNYETNSQQQQNKRQNGDKQPPKMLIRCVNQFSDFEHDHQHQQQEQQKKKKNGKLIGQQ